MKQNLHDEIVDRAAEERSEDDGMPEHAAKARDPVRWAADRGRRVSQRSLGHAGLSGVALMSCTVLASARGAFRRIWHMGVLPRLPR
jgi:hypothetical protein